MLPSNSTENVPDLNPLNTYLQNLLNSNPLNFNGTEAIVGAIPFDINALLAILQSQSGLSTSAETSSVPTSETSSEIPSETPSEIPSESPSEPPPAPLYCQICSGYCRNMNGKPICKSCKEFFTRTVKHHKVYKCQRVGKCVIIRKNSNSYTCKACRLKKCLENGLNPKDVLGNGQDFKAPFPPSQQELSVEMAEQYRAARAGPNPNIQFLNIRDSTKSFLFEVLNWPRQCHLFEELQPNEKRQLLSTQWIFISFLTICENGAHLLDLQENLSLAVEEFNRIMPTSDELFCMKSVLLFMKRNTELEFQHQFHLEDALMELKYSTFPQDWTSVRFGEIMLFLGTIVHLSFNEIREFFKDTVSLYLINNF